MITVPPQFQQPHPFEYPEHNKVIFEDWFLRNWTPEDAKHRTYLPILWTSYYCANKYGMARREMHELQNFVSQLDKSKKYYTIVQYDNGIVTNLRNLDIKIFAMSGPKIDYPLPLIGEPHPYEFNEQRSILASFTGAQTHVIRKQMYRWFKSRSGFAFSFSRLGSEEFCKTLARSVFALCPRGFGQTSFRIAEALQYGAIPVYISDKHIIPHNVNFDYGLLIRPDGLRGIESRLRNMTSEEIKSLQDKGKIAYKELFSYEGCKKRILQCLESQDGFCSDTPVQHSISL